MSQPQRLAVKDTTAAKMLDMPATEFRRLVANGALPGPKRIGDHERWCVRDIETIIEGNPWPEDEDIEA